MCVWVAGWRFYGVNIRQAFWSCNLDKAVADLTRPGTAAPLREENVSVCVAQTKKA